MKNSIIFYAAIALGVIALVLGAYYQFGTPGQHSLRAPVGMGVGVVLLIVGIVGMFMTRSRATATK